MSRGLEKNNGGASVMSVTEDIFEILMGHYKSLLILSIRIIYYLTQICHD